jgi:uncharacterized membrane protein YkoI
MQLTKWIMAAALAAPIVSATAYADDTDTTSGSAQGQKDLKMSDLPSAVRSTVQREAKGKQVESIKQDTQNGKTIYDVQFGTGDKEQKLQISSGGNVLSRQPSSDQGSNQDMTPSSSTP